MPDREKVITALEEHLHCSGRGKSGYCPYADDELWNDISDALALLKEQEPVAPKRIDGKKNHFIKCGDCNVDLMTGMNFCPKCGRAVKWDA